MNTSKKNTLSVLMFGLAGLITMSNAAFSQSECQGGGMSVRFDLSKTNNTHIDNKNTYIVVLGIDPITKKHAYVNLMMGTIEEHVLTLLISI